MSAGAVNGGTRSTARFGGRASGILLHPTSLPGLHGIGDLGASAYRFLDQLAAARQSLWQVLPLGPTGYGDSPYACFSSFAGNPLIVSLDALRERGLVTPDELAAVGKCRLATHVLLDFVSEPSD